MTEPQQWSPSLTDAFAVFRLHCQAQRYSPTTITFYERRIGPFIEWCATQQAGELARITANHLRAYIAMRQEAGASPHYLHGIARSLRTFFSFCVNEEWLDRSPMARVAMPRLPSGPKPAFDEEDIAALCLP